MTTVKWAAESRDATAEIDPAPIEYLEMLVLPRQGIAYSEIKRMTLVERHLLYAMLEIEARPAFIPRVD